MIIRETDAPTFCGAAVRIATNSSSRRKGKGTRIIIDKLELLTV